MDTNLAVRNALYLATDEVGQRGLTPTQQEVSDFLAHLGEAGYAIVAVPPVVEPEPVMCGWRQPHLYQVAARGVAVCGWDTLHGYVPVTETHHPESGEPHQFHDGESCFPGCPAWDSKTVPLGEQGIVNITMPEGADGERYRLTLADDQPTQYAGQSAMIDGPLAAIIGFVIEQVFES